MATAKKPAFDITAMLNNVSRGDSPKTKRVKIDYTLLVPSEYNHYSIENIEALADTFENVGVIQDPLVKPINDNSGKYLIVAGHRRIEAIKLLVEQRNNESFREVYCVVGDADEDVEVTKLKLHLANLTARDMTEYEKMIGIEEVEKSIVKLREQGVDVKGRARELIAETAGLSPRQVQTYLTVSKKATNDTKADLHRGEITLTQAYEKTVEGGYKDVAVTATSKKTAKPSDATQKSSKRVIRLSFQFQEIADYFPAYTEEGEIKTKIIEALKAFFKRDDTIPDLSWTTKV